MGQWKKHPREAGIDGFAGAAASALKSASLVVRTSVPRSLRQSGRRGGVSQTGCGARGVVFFVFPSLLLPPHGAATAAVLAS